jgi:hypothetical protein
MATTKFAIDFDDDDPSGVRMIDYDDGKDEDDSKDEAPTKGKSTVYGTARQFFDELTTLMFHEQKDPVLKLRTLHLNPEQTCLSEHLTVCEECRKEVEAEEADTFF